jgi:iron complex transport system ATP-binding protein
MLSALGMCVKRGDRRVLGPIDLELRARELVAICGPNGAGKSTLLKALCGELRLECGEINLDGRPLAKVTPMELARRRAVVPQATALAFPFTVLEVVELGASVPGFARARSCALAALERSGIADMAHRLYLELSGGELQKVHFARALCQLEAAPLLADETTFLLLDEPTSNLDLPHQAALLNSARQEIERGRIVVAVLHDLNLAARWADRLILVSGGMIVGDGKPQAIINDEMLSRAYDCPVHANRLPADGAPFVLPQLFGGRGMHA